MATCKNDCVHSPVCRLPFNKSKTQLNCVEVCNHFKNKADFVEVKHGEWENFEIPHMMRCSECGVSDLDIHRTKFSFCPYCGADMRKEGEGK